MDSNLRHSLPSRKGLKYMSYCGCCLAPIKFILFWHLELPIIYDLLVDYGPSAAYLFASGVLLLYFGLPYALLYSIHYMEDNECSTKFLRIWLAIKGFVTLLNYMEVFYIFWIKLEGSVDLGVIINCIVWRLYEILEIVRVSRFIFRAKVNMYTRMEEPPDYVTVTDPTNQFKFPVIVKEDDPPSYDTICHI